MELTVVHTQAETMTSMYTSNASYAQMPWWIQMIFWKGLAFDSLSEDLFPNQARKKLYYNFCFSHIDLYDFYYSL